MVTSAASHVQLLLASFIVDLSTAAVSQRKSASAQTSCDNYCVQGHDKRDTLWVNILRFSWMAYIVDVIDPDNGAGLSTEIQTKDLVADVTKARIAFIFSVKLSPVDANDTSQAGICQI